MYSSTKFSAFLEKLIALAMHEDKMSCTKPEEDRGRVKSTERVWFGAASLCPSVRVLQLPFAMYLSFQSSTVHDF